MAADFTTPSFVTAQYRATSEVVKKRRPLSLSKRAVVFNIRGERNSQNDLGADASEKGYRASFSYIDQFMDNRLGITFGAAGAGLLAVLFLFAGASKLVLPVEAMQQGPVHFSGSFLRFIGVAEVLEDLTTPGRNPACQLHQLLNFRPPALSPLESIDLLVAKLCRCSTVEEAAYVEAVAAFWCGNNPQRSGCCRRGTSAVWLIDARI